jgi:effector-binding domain-containing protein
MQDKTGRVLALVTLTMALVLGAPGQAQTPSTPPAVAQPAAPAPATPAPSPAPPVATPAPTPAPPALPGAVVQPAPSTPVAPPAASTQSTPTPPDGDASSAQAIDVKARPAVVIRGAANWDDGYKAIMGAIAKVRAATLKAGLKEAGRPIASFVDTDDNGFKYEAMIPIEAAPTGAVDLGTEAKLGATPAGKAIKFQHRGAYDDVDSTYEAITAYLDEKGYDAQNVFVEEYLNDPKGSDDTGLALDIYVFIK